jgi:hypothetical protein
MSGPSWLGQKGIQESEGLGPTNPYIYIFIFIYPSGKTIIYIYPSHLYMYIIVQQHL